MQADSHSIRQVFDEEKQDLAIFHAKTRIDYNIFLSFELCYKGSTRPNLTNTKTKLITAINEILGVCLSICLLNQRKCSR